MADYTLGSLIWRIRGETADFDKKITASNKKIGAIADKTKAVSKSLTTFLTAPLVGAGIAATKAASDLEESINAVSVVFGDSADTINEWGKDAADNAGLSRSAFNELATTIGSQLKQSGLEIDEVADRTTELTQRSADLASVFNVDVKEATNTLGSALRGEAEPARRFGVNISAAAVQAEALASGLVNSKDEITEQVKVQARYNIIMQQSEQVAGDFANTSDSLANQTRIVKSELVNVAAELGENLIPIATDMVEVAGDLVGWFGDLSDAEQRQVVVLGGVAAAIGPVLIGISSLTKAYQVLATSVLFGPVGLIAGTVALGVALAATADEQDRAIVSNSAVNEGYDDLRKLARDARSETREFATAQDVAAEAAKVSGDRYEALADNTRNAGRAAQVAGMRYAALAESLGVVAEQRSIDVIAAQAEALDGIIGLGISEAEVLEKKIALRTEEIERIKDQAFEEGELSDALRQRIVFQEGEIERYNNRLEELSDDTVETEVENNAVITQAQRDALNKRIFERQAYELEKRGLDDETREKEKENYGEIGDIIDGFYSLLVRKRDEDVDDEEATYEEKKEALKEFYSNAAAAVSGFYNMALSTRMQNLENEATAVEQYYDRELSALKKKNEQGLISDEEYKDQKTALEQEQAQELYEIELEQFKAQQEADIIRARIASFQLAVQAYKALAGIPVVGPALGAAAAAAGLAFGQAQVDSIKGQPEPQAPQFAEGGFVQPRPGVSDTGDRVPARLNPREVVLTESDATELLNFIRSPKSGGVTINQYNTLNTDSEKNMQRAARQLYPYLDREGARRG